MNRTLIAAVGAAALLLAGCSSNSDSGSTDAATSSTEASAATTTAQATCPAGTPIEDPAFAAAVATVPLPAGATLIGGRVSTDSDEPGMIATAIDICDPNITTADELRPIATQYAKALKASPLSETIFAVYVESYQVNGNDVENDVKLKEGDFQLHLWNGKPSEAAELGYWEVIAG